MSKPESLAELLAGLPPEPSEAELFPVLKQKVAESGRKLVVVDDDPTGVQTVHDVTLLTEWDEDSLTRALEIEPKLFFLLTNSRSLPVEEAAGINLQIARQLKSASRKSGIDFVVASRSDSTLRGHYPAEILALETELGFFNGHLIVPAFFEGGRYTINDIHYVATPSAASNDLIPADQTPFAGDKVFGYKTSYLPDWVEEKSYGHWTAGQVASLDLKLIRQGGPEAVAKVLEKIDGGQPVIVNAAGYGDLAVVTLGLLEAEARGKRFLYRTAAGFVRMRGAVDPRPLLTPTEILSGSLAGGGLVVVGSYVPGSTVQLENLLSLQNIQGVELEVDRVTSSAAASLSASREAGQILQKVIAGGKTAVLFTSRKLITGTTDKETLEIGQKVSTALINALHEITIQPRFIVAKGGITSQVVAQKGLGAVRAKALGQLLPGVPVWRLESGPDLKFNGVPYIVFPGNVGGPESLAEAVKKLSLA